MISQNPEWAWVGGDAQKEGFLSSCSSSFCSYWYVPSCLNKAVLCELISILFHPVPFAFVNILPLSEATDPYTS